MILTPLHDSCCLDRFGPQSLPGFRPMAHHSMKFFVLWRVDLTLYQKTRHYKRNDLLHGEHQSRRILCKFVVVQPTANFGSMILGAETFCSLQCIKDSPPSSEEDGLFEAEPKLSRRWRLLFCSISYQCTPKDLYALLAINISIFDCNSIG